MNEPGMVDVDVEAGETVLDVYERNGWGDGLPLEAPTPNGSMPCSGRSLLSTADPSTPTR